MSCNPSAYSSFSTDSGSSSSYLAMAKLNQSNGAYDDGIYYYFGPNTPEHIRLEMKTDSPDVESCDIRLTTINDTTSLVYRKIPWQDVAFFRFGYYNY